jgi:hypothetical protein
LTSEKKHNQFFFFFQEKTNAINYFSSTGSNDHLEPARHAVAQPFQETGAELHGPQLLVAFGQLGDRGVFKKFFKLPCPKVPEKQSQTIRLSGCYTVLIV